MVDVVLVTDKNYFNYALTTIQSLLRNTKSEVLVTCIVTDVEIKDVIRAKEFFKNKIEIMGYDASSLQHIKTKNHISVAAYIKVLLPQIFSEKEKIIFLDSDILVREDIAKIWDEFSDDYIIQAVWDPDYSYDNKVLGLSENDETFNSGVMLMNLQRMREVYITEKLLEFIEKKNHLTKLNDQAAFNGVFAHSWGRLDLKWNVQYHLYWTQARALKMDQEEKRELLNNPSILHFTTHSKPWMFRNAHPFKNEFKEIFNEVNGKIQYDDISLKSMLQRIKEDKKIKKFM